MRKPPPSHEIWNKHNPDDKIERGNYKNVIHHIDGNHDNNEIINLQKMSHADHKGLHAKGNKYWLGKKHTEETKRKIGLKSIGRRHGSGYKMLEEAKRNMSKSRKAWWKKNTISEETRKKLRAAANKRWNNV